ncbi:hypothetical protein ACJJTC_004954 [Scirpophaga incertulas]
MERAIQNRKIARCRFTICKKKLDRCIEQQDSEGMKSEFAKLEKVHEDLVEIQNSILSLWLDSEDKSDEIIEADLETVDNYDSDYYALQLRVAALNRNREHNDEFSSEDKQDMLSAASTTLTVDVATGKPVHQTESSVTTDDIRQIIKEELESVLNSFKVSILKEFEQRTKELVENFNQISEAIKVFEQQQENLITDLKSNSERINVLEAENISLKDTVIDLQSRIDRIEQHSRASNLEIQNVP